MTEKTSDLTAAQRKLYLHQKVFPHDNSYNLAYVFRITGDIDAGRLRDAVETFVHSNVALNTVFAERDGEIRAVHDPELRYEVPLVRHDGDASGRLRDRLARMVREKIPTDVWPLFEYTVQVDPQATYLTLYMSHLICDVFSFYNIGREIGRLYDDPSVEVTGTALSPADFPDDPASSAEATEFFRSMLGALPTLALDQLEAGRTEEGTLEGSHVWVPLDAELSDSVDTTIGHLGVRKFSFFLAVHLLLLGTLSGSRAVTVGIPLGGRRKDPQQRIAFGYFVNTLPLAVDLDAYATFGELCRAVESRMGSLIRHEDFDPTAHAEEILPAGATGRMTPSSSCTYYREQLAFTIGGSPAESLHVPRTDLVYPLVTRVEDFGDGYGVHLAHTHAMAASDPRDSLLSILRSVARGADVELSQVRGVSPEHVAAVDRLVNQHATFSTDRSLQAVFERRAAEHPDHVAVEYGAERRTYRELDHQANRIARHLRDTVTADHVAVALDRGCDLIAVLLGVLKAGKTYVPVDPAAPDARVRHIIDQFGELPLITGPGVFADLAHEDAIPLRELLAESAGLTADALPAQDLRDRAAYVIFTSGSTGKPKGVQVTHGNVLRLFLSAGRHFTFTADDTWCLFHSYAFDFAVWEMYGALLHGGRLVIPAEVVRKSPDRFADFLTDTGVTVLNQTPSAFRRLSQALGERHAGRSKVRYVVFGGEALQFDCLTRWFDLFGEQAELVNMYGITETTVHVTYYRVTEKDALGRGPSVIGKPLADLEIRVVDTNLAPVPVGVPGEMLVAGAGVSLGYLGRPDLTAERFVELPGEEGRFYRSGDLARVLPDGNLVYLGRMDQQVQLRGYRIELGEVETALRGVPGITDCAVLLDEQADEPRLVAFVVRHDGLGDRDLREVMRDLLPSYMLPSLYVAVPALPLTINGKVDSAALPWPREQAGTQLSLAEADQDAPPSVAVVARVWREVLGQSEFTADDRFFDVGGTSVQVVHVHERLCREFGTTELEMIDLFEYTTVRELAGFLDKLNPAAGRAA
ncbi:amino acid adenylation domain-containing protein [Streptomyces sp. NPDC058297]|uniref:non-ribosomal peptide synthetase n=1 Tax=Streptomyces sp. NPDC058297 TaxID=3346433 RepID=UPI0036F16C9A